MIEKKPKVSVCVVTFNQEKYIRQCLQSIIDQETDSHFEVIVSDDCSTDGTRTIIEEFEEKYPSMIKSIFHKENIGAYKNFVFVHSQAVGEYIAHVDGDDYYLPGKIEAQVKVLETSPNCNIVWHRMMLELPDGSIREGPLHDIYNLKSLKFDRGAIIQNISIGFNSSKMYRKSIREYAEPSFDVVDYFANVEQVGEGFAQFTGHEYYGVYRVGVGISSSGIKTRQILAKCFLFFYEKYPEYQLQINTAALMCFVADLKNKRKTWPVFLKVWIKTFHIGSPFNLFRNLNFIKQLQLAL